MERQLDELGNPVELRCIDVFKLEFQVWFLQTRHHYH